MTLKPTLPKHLNSDWDLEDDGAGATREVEPDELFVRAGLVPGGRAGASHGDAHEAPSSSSPTTVPPPMPTAEYVDQMMRLAPPSDTGLLSLGSDIGDGFDALTPWASMPLERDPESISSLLMESPEAPSAPVTKPAREDLGAAGTAAYNEVDFSELMPEISTQRRPPTAPPRSAGDELDKLLSDEALRVVRGDVSSLQEAAPGRSDSGELALDLAFDDPAFLPSSGDSSAEPPPELSLDLDGIDDRTVTELPDMALLPPRDLDDDSIEPGPDTMVEAALPREAPKVAGEGSIQARLERLRARFEVGDFSGALVIAEGMLDEVPRHLAARCYADSCRAMLQQMYQARIGDRAKVLRVIMPVEQLKWLTFDHRMGFLLSCIDGTSTIDDVLDVSGMQPLDALRMLYDLIQQGVVEVEPPPERT